MDKKSSRFEPPQSMKSLKISEGSIDVISQLHDARLENATIKRDRTLLN
jgi:hypothetical protein